MSQQQPDDTFAERLVKTYDEKIAERLANETPLNTWIFFLATAHPTGSDDHLQYLRGLRQKDIMYNTEVIKLNVPTFFEHNFSREPVGFVFGAVVDDQGKLVVMGYLNIGTPGGHTVFLEHKLYGDMGMSVTISTSRDQETKNILEKEILEISFTRYPALPDTGMIFMAGLPESLKKRDMEFRTLVSNFGRVVNGM